MRPREPLADCRQPHKVQERPLQALDNRAAGRGRTRRLRRKAQETKNLLEHLIELNQETEAAPSLASR